MVSAEDNWRGCFARGGLSSVPSRHPLLGVQEGKIEVVGRTVGRVRGIVEPRRRVHEDLPGPRVNRDQAVLPLQLGAAAEPSAGASPAGSGRYGGVTLVRVRCRDVAPLGQPEVEERAVEPERRRGGVDRGRHHGPVRVHQDVDAARFGLTTCDVGEAARRSPGRGRDGEPRSLVGRRPCRQVDDHVRGQRHLAAARAGHRPASDRVGLIQEAGCRWCPIREYDLRVRWCIHRLQTARQRSQPLLGLGPLGQLVDGCR